MASEKQIAANRRNAMRSTGPKSRLGKFRSSRNALRHGFSLGLALDPASIRRVNSLKGKLLSEGASKDTERAGEEFARAEIQIASIRNTQSKALAELVKAPEGDHTKEIRRLAALDRYERYALTLRQRAQQVLENCQNEAN
jgi:hypothetical protein